MVWTPGGRPTGTSGGGRIIEPIVPPTTPSDAGTYTDASGKPISRAEAERQGRISGPGATGEALKKIGVTSGATGAIPAGTIEGAKKAELPSERTFFLGTAQTGFRERPQELTQASRAAVVQSFYPQPQQEVQRIQPQMDTSILFQPPGPRPIQEAQARVAELYRPKEYALITGLPLVKTRYEYTTQRPYLSEYSILGFPFGKQIPVEEGVTYIKPSLFGRLQKVKTPMTTRLVSETDISRLQIGAAGVALTAPVMPKMFAAVKGRGLLVTEQTSKFKNPLLNEFATSYKKSAEIDANRLKIARQRLVEPSSERLVSGRTGYHTPLAKLEVRQIPETTIKPIQLQEQIPILSRPPGVFPIQTQMQERIQKQVSPILPTYKPVFIQTTQQTPKYALKMPQITLQAQKQPLIPLSAQIFKPIQIQEQISTLTPERTVFKPATIETPRIFERPKIKEYPKYEGTQLFTLGKKRRKVKRKARVFGEVSPIASIGEMFRKRGRK